MDLNASAPYEFLDLTDIDDNERKQLICTLYKTAKEDTNSLNDTAVKSKKTPHGTSSNTNKDYNSKHSRYESGKYVKNIAAINLTQQLATNANAHVDSGQAKVKISRKPANQSISTMAAHTSISHHQSQQQQQQQQQQAQQQQQHHHMINSQTQPPQQPPQSTAQNNNYQQIHPSQQVSYNQLPPGGVFLPSHGGTPVGGTMYQMLPAAALSPSVYVNNVTANVNLHGYVTQPMPQYISPNSTSGYLPSDVQQNTPQLVNEQPNQIVQQTSAVAISRTTTRRGGRSRGNNGGQRRNDFTQRQQANSTPQEVVGSPVDPQTIAPGAGFSPYFPYTYPHPYFSAPQNIAHQQAQHASGAPVYFTGPLYAGHHVYPVNYHPSLVYQAILPQEYPIMDEKGEEQSPQDGLMQQMWHPHMQFEYPEEYLHHEMVDDVNHNPSPLNSAHTPSLLSPMLQPMYDSHIQPPMDMQQHMNEMHLYDTSSLSQQSLQSDEQVQDCQQLNEIITQEQIEQTTIAEQSIITEQNMPDNREEELNSLNNNDVHVAPIIEENNIPQTIQDYSNVVNMHQQVPASSPPPNVVFVQTVVPNDPNQNVPNVESQQDVETELIHHGDENGQSVEEINPTNINNEEISTQNGQKPASCWNNQIKKSTASVAVTATPVENNKQELLLSGLNVSTGKSAIPPTLNGCVTTITTQVVQVKSHEVMKVPSSPSTSEVNNLENKNVIQPQPQSVAQQQPQVGNLNEQVKSVTTTSIASTVVPHQLQETKTGYQAHATLENRKQELAYVQDPVKDSNKMHLENLPKSKKEESAIPSLIPLSAASVAAQQRKPTSWASLFQDKSSSNLTNQSPTIGNTIPLSVTKKPVAKVLPFEGTSNFVPSSPGTMSYSAASAQGLPASQPSTANLKPKLMTSVAPMVPESTKESVDEWALKFAEFLTKYKTDYTPVSLRPRGLTNRSNYCYINAILQALVGCPPFYNLMKAIPKQPPAIFTEKTNFPTINAMIELISEFSHLPQGARLISRRDKGQKKDDMSSELQCDPAFEPTAIYKLWNANRSDDEGRQEDAEEFLGFVLNKLNDEMLEIMKLIAKPVSDHNGDANVEGDDGGDWQICDSRNKGSVTRQTDFGRTPLSDIFRGEVRSKLQRGNEHSTYVIQPFFTLPLNIEKAASVKEALEILVGRDQLEGVTCSKTNQEIDAWQQMNLEKLPVVLILHLKWFDYKLDGCTKILKTVDFPVDLKIDGKILASKKHSQKQRLYRLFAVVYHDGKEASKGHYITDVHHAGYLSWLRFDDSTVKPVSENNVLRPRAPRVPYLLYYRRCDTVTTPTQNVNNK